MAAFSTTSTGVVFFQLQQQGYTRRRLPMCSFQQQSMKIGLKSCGTRATAIAINQEEVKLDSSCSSWLNFAEKVSGEWDGFGADFTVEGNPIELPESVVPGAYREWEVKVFDWQTQCPTLAQLLNDDKNNSLFYKTIKLLPTVGCEADAATVHTIEERNIIDSSSSSSSATASTASTASAFAYQPSTGCYVAIWGGLKKEEKYSSIELEHCLVDPRDKESRVRIIPVFGFLQDPQDGLTMRLKGIKVFVEQWYGPFRNGDQLGGCAIRDSAFAATPPLNASLLTAGIWQANTTAIATIHTHTHTHTHHHQNLNIQQLTELDEDESTKSIRRTNEGHLILLPRNLWCSIRIIEDETHCEVGWLLAQGQAITSTCIFSSITKELKKITIANEALVS